MKFTIITVGVIVSLAFSSFKTATIGGKDCQLVVTYAEMAYGHFKKAYKAGSVDEAQKLLKKGVDEASQASAYAVNPQCGCDIAKNFALDAVTYGNKARKAEDLAAMKKFTKTAMDTSLDAMSAVSGCK